MKRNVTEGIEAKIFAFCVGGKTMIDRGADGSVITKTAQVRMCGNSVCPPVTRSLVSANFNQAQERMAA